MGQPARTERTLNGTESGQDPARQIERRIAQELERLGGVLAAVVSLDEGGQHLRDVYITAGPGANAAAIRQATSELLLRSGIAAPPGSIRIAILDHAAQAGPGGARSGFASNPRFLLLLDIETNRAAGRTFCRVSLQVRDQVLHGEAGDTDSDAGRARAAARAILQAAEMAAPGVHLGLHGILLVDLAGQPHVAIAVEAAANRRYALLSGIAAISGAVEDAACCATLSAIERWLTG